MTHRTLTALRLLLIFGQAVAVGFMLAGLLALAGGCAESPVPHLVEYPLGEFDGFDGDGAPKRLDAVNPLPVAVEMRVRCAGDSYSWPMDVRVPARGAVRGLIQTARRDLWDTACQLLYWRASEPLRF